MTVDSASLFSLYGKTALVTGSVRGLGLEIAKGYAQAGAAIIVHGRQAQQVQHTVEGLRANGYTAHPTVFDIDDHKTTAQQMDALFAQHGHIDILCNNAGIRDRRGLQALDMESIQQVLHTNLLAVIHLCKQFLQHQSAHMQCSIVNITSMQGHMLRREDFVYPISKQGVETMTRALAVEYGPRGLRCNAIAPGSFATEFNAQLLSKPENKARAMERNPLQRWGKPDEIVGPAIFLASEAASYVNGVTLKVDGGFGIHF